jgi:glucokinase
MVNLVGDIGGTNTRLALADGPKLRLDSVAKFRNAQYDSLETVIRIYLSVQGNPDCDAACVAVAGPVKDGVGTLTNVDGKLESATLADAAQAEHAEVINDLQAQGFAIGHHLPGTLETIFPGKPDENGTKLVMGVGTGMNIAAAFETPEGRVVPPAEAGHISLPLATDDDWALARFLESRYGFPSVEEALSGRGLEHIHEWATGGTKLSTSEIIEAAAKGGQKPLKAVHMFTRLLGQLAGDHALTFLPQGGIYLIGGMVLATKPWFKTGGFESAFHRKGRFSDFMRQFAVYVVTDDYAALSGAAAHIAPFGK